MRKPKVGAVAIATIAAAVYAALTLAIGCWNHDVPRPQATHYVAARALPRNHRIVAADLKMPPAAREWLLPPRSALEGKYTATAIGPNRAVIAANLRSEPIIVPQLDGRVPVPIAFPADVPPNLVDTGALVDVIASERTVAQRARVAAVWCSSATSCSALVFLPPAIAAALGDKPRFVIRTDAGGGPMDQKQWVKVAAVDVPSKPAAIWTKVIDYVPANTVLKLEALGQWHYADNVQCGPDGDVSPKLRVETLSNAAPVGAVIGKIGGSTATATQNDANVFAVGSFAVVTVQTAGPLFLTINVAPSQFPATAGTIKVTISETRP